MRQHARALFLGNIATRAACTTSESRNCCKCSLAQAEQALLLLIFFYYSDGAFIASHSFDRITYVELDGVTFSFVCYGLELIQSSPEHTIVMFLRNCITSGKLPATTDLGDSKQCCIIRSCIPSSNVDMDKVLM